MHFIMFQIMPRSVVLHAADLHLDAPFEGVGRMPSHVAAVLRDASLGAWDALVEVATTRNVDAVLLAGGLCGGLERGVRAQVQLRDGLARLTAAGIRVFIVLAEGDPTDGLISVGGWPAGVTVFGGERPEAVTLERGGVRLATIHGVSAAPARRDPTARFARGDAAGPHLAMLHASIAGRSADDSSGVVSRLGDLRAADMNYWALGRSRALDDVSRARPWIVYPGTPQGRGVALDECGPKGVVLVTIDEGVVARVDFEPLDRVRCVCVDVLDVHDPSALERTLVERAAALREEHAGRPLLLTARVDGAAATRVLRPPDRRLELLGALRRAAATWEPFAWWVDVHAAPAAAHYRAAVLAGDDLAAEVERCRARLADDPEQCARFLARRFEPLRDAWTAELDAREAEALLDEAAAVAVGALREDGA
jgi:DNA repair exonuclease SbcCD nuclease subunit